MNKKAGIITTILNVIVYIIYILGWITHPQIMIELHKGLYEWFKGMITTIIGWVHK